MSAVTKARQICQEDGLTELIKRAYNAYAPTPLVFKYANFKYGIKRTLTEPNILRGHIRMNVLKPVNNFAGQKIHSKKENDVMSEDWDNLIILDACRYDTFEKVNDIEGDLSYVYSNAPETSRFLKRTFEGKQYHDTVYISANPKVPSEIVDGTFHAVVSVWEEEWDDDVSSVRPSKVTEYAKKAAEKYPNKRLIVHYLQPHMPLIGNEGHQFMRQNELCKGQSRDWLKISWGLRYGLLDITDDELRKLYKENLTVALDSVAYLTDQLAGKSVITSDHAELLGERVGSCQ